MRGKEDMTGMERDARESAGEVRRYYLYMPWQAGAHTLMLMLRSCVLLVLMFTDRYVPRTKTRP